MTLLAQARPGPARSDRPRSSTPDAPAVLLDRVRRAVVCVALFGLALSQEPGRIVADTKLDLVVDPAGFLGRALRLWEPAGFAGQVQNQSYGYLFPMGPFFAAGTALGLPEWVVQRLWLGVLLSTAFLGATALARALRIGTPGARILAGLAYALAPKMVSELGAISIEVLPMAVAPWVLLPLVVAQRTGSPRRAAACSALAVFCVGGVNAAATVAVLPLPALWLLTRTPGPRRRRLMGWWVGCVLAAVAWWLGPLLLLGRYSPPFLDYIENAAVTTAPADLTSALRGTTAWLAYLGSPYGPQWPAGWALVHDALPVAATVVLAAVGLAALTARGVPERAFLGLGALVGLVLLTAAHTGPGQGLLAPPLQALLDRGLAPLRNVHKFDLVLRLPLAMGVAHVVGLAARRAAAGTRRARVRSGVTIGAVGLAVAGVAGPALTGGLAPTTGYSAIPQYWRATADWLAAHDATGRALLVPGSSIGLFRWGTTSDEPLQPLARTAWDVRSAVPLTPPEHIRMLDAVQARLAQGRGGPGLTRYLARAGFTTLVVRNDLDTGAADTVRPLLVHRALADSPGLVRVASFGPTLDVAHVPGVVVDADLGVPLPAVEIYAVADPAPRAWTAPLSAAVAVTGGPDALLQLEDRGLVTGAPALLDGPPPSGARRLVGDALVRRERTFGRIDDATSAPLTRDDPLRLTGRVPDYPVADPDANLAVVTTSGGTVTASSSRSDPNSYGGARPGDHPYAAVDGDPGTAWRPAITLDGEPVWWRLVADHAVADASVTVTLSRELADIAPTRLRVGTDTGQVDVPIARTTAPQRLGLPPGSTRSLTITADPEPGTALGLAEVDLPGVTVSRTTSLPAATGPVAAYAFDAADPPRTGCVPVAGEADADDVRCSADLVRSGAEPTGLDRAFSVHDAAAYDLTVTAVPRPGAALDQVIADARLRATRGRAPVLTATASSAAVPDPRAGGAVAVDGDLRTVWRAAADDTQPTLTLASTRPVTLDRLRVLSAAWAGATPTALTVRVPQAGGDQVRTVTLAADGTAVFAPLTGDRFVLTFPLRRDLDSYDPVGRTTRPLGIAVADIAVPEGRRPAADGPVDLPCGQGPPVTLDGAAVPTSLHTTVSALLAGAGIPLVLCGPLGNGRSGGAGDADGDPRDGGTAVNNTTGGVDGVTGGIAVDSTAVGASGDTRGGTGGTAVDGTTSGTGGGVVGRTAARAGIASDRGFGGTDRFDATRSGGIAPSVHADASTDGERTPTLAAGPHRLTVAAVPAFGIASATLTTGAAQVAPVARTAATVVAWTAEDRSVALPARSAPTLLVVPENTNPGWTATLADSTALVPRTVDGWQQGYVVLAGQATTVTLHFAPGPVYRAALGGGALAVLVVLLLALWPDRGLLPPSVRRRPRLGVLAGVGVVTAVGLTGGFVGLTALAAFVVAFTALGRLAPGRREALLAALATTAFLAAGATLLAAPATTAALRQSLAAVAVAALAAALLRPLSAHSLGSRSLGDQLCGSGEHRVTARARSTGDGFDHGETPLRSMSAEFSRTEPGEAAWTPDLGAEAAGRLLPPVPPGRLSLRKSARPVLTGLGGDRVGARPLGSQQGSPAVAGVEQGSPAAVPSAPPRPDSTEDSP